MLWLALVPSPACPYPPWPELACRLGRYTPRLVLREEGLLAELASSLRLFGGLAALRGRIQDDLSHCPVWLAVAATPLGALWLARASPGAACPDLPATRAALADVPVAELAWPPEVAERIDRFGLRRLGEVLALPREGLALRLGKEFARDLGRALGEIDHPQAWYEFPARFEQRVELPAPVESAPALMFAARRLVAALAGWLAAHQAALREMRWEVRHDTGDRTGWPLMFAVPVHDPSRIERVLVERLGCLQLPAPAVELALRVDRPEPRTVFSRSLFGPRAGTGDALAEVCDRLAVRLGGEAIFTLACVAEYRPERASRKVGAGGTAGTDRDRPRPLWLAPEPLPLTEKGGRPAYRGRLLQVFAGPERIESGWWDGDDVRRDYFVAVTTDGEWLWVFRRQGADSSGWYLHGWFA